LIVQEGAYFDGNSKMATGNAPSAHTNSSSGRAAASERA
jgi:hypothetical protein